jgi:hypothetical protein
MTSGHRFTARMVRDHLTWGEYATGTTAPDSSEAAEGFRTAMAKILRAGRPHSSDGESKHSTAQLR